MQVERDTTALRSWLTVGVGAYVVAVGVLYVALLGETVPEDRWPVVVVAATIIGSGLLLAAAGLAVAPALRVILAAAVAGALLVWGVLAIFSIGVPLLVAAVLALFAALAAIDRVGARGWLLALAGATGGLGVAAASAAIVLALHP